MTNSLYLAIVNISQSGVLANSKDVCGESNPEKTLQVRILPLTIDLSDVVAEH